MKTVRPVQTCFGRVRAFHGVSFGMAESRVCLDSGGFVFISWKNRDWGFASSSSPLEEGERVSVIGELNGLVRVERRDGSKLDLPVLKLEGLMKSPSGRGFMPARLALRVGPEARHEVMRWIEAVERSSGMALLVGDLSRVAGLFAPGCGLLSKAGQAALDAAVRQFGGSVRGGSEEGRLELLSWKKFLRSLDPAPRTLGHHWEALSAWSKSKSKSGFAPAASMSVSGFFLGRPLTPHEADLHAEGRCISCGAPAARVRASRNPSAQKSIEHECVECWRMRHGHVFPDQAALINPLGRAGLSREYKSRLGYGQSEGAAPDKPEDE